MKNILTIILSSVITTALFGQSQMNIYRHSVPILQIPLSDIDSITYSTITAGPVVPSVTTTAVNNISVSGCTSGGTILFDGGDPVTERGICYGTTSNPTIFGSKTQHGAGTGSFADTLSGLVSGTTYYLRAYATNSIGTGYGSQVVFTTSTNGPVNTITITDSVLESVSIYSSFLYPTKYVYPNLKRVNFNIDISNTNNIVEIDFPLLDSVGNNIYISGNISLQKFIAPKLRSTGTIVDVYANHQLQQLDICNLKDQYCTGFGEPYTSVANNNTAIDSAAAACLHPTLHVTEMYLNPVTVFSNNTAIVTGLFTHFCYVSYPELCWSTHPNPTIDDFAEDLMYTNPDISNTLVSLLPNTTYYVRAYFNGRYYNEVSFTTTP